jgi:hypothetical protein
MTFFLSARLLQLTQTIVLSLTKHAIETGTAVLIEGVKVEIFIDTEV